MIPYCGSFGGTGGPSTILGRGFLKGRAGPLFMTNGTAFLFASGATGNSLSFLVTIGGALATLLSNLFLFMNRLNVPVDLS